MSVIPCRHDASLSKQVSDFAEVLRTQAHTLGAHGLSEIDFYQGGVFRGAIERIRGQYSAAMKEKRAFVRQILNYMQDQGFVREWISAGESNRHDYTITLASGRVSVVELKGCLDGNNTTIFERPANAHEFTIWSVCSNAGANPRHNVWSGIHTRLSPEIISNNKQVDGLIVWDWLCGTAGRPCPKVGPGDDRRTIVGQYKLTPPCIYLFPATIPNVRNNPQPEPHALQNVELLDALHRCFGGRDEEVNRVRFRVSHRGNETVRVTTIERGGATQHTSDETPIRRN